MNGHTPGPMCVLYSAQAVALYLAASAASANAKNRVLRMDRTDANVQFLRTLAAAPELLAFAQAVADAGMDEVGGIDVHELIAKATGGAK